MGSATRDTVSKGQIGVIRAIIAKMPKAHLLLYAMALLIFFIAAPAIPVAYTSKSTPAYVVIAVCLLGLLASLYCAYRLACDENARAAGGSVQLIETSPGARVPHENEVVQIMLGGDWTFCLIGEDQSDMLQRLADALKAVSPGEQRVIASGFSYWGIGPTLAWINACQDRGYRVMNQGAAIFRNTWEGLHKKREHNYHYVSLGVGNGKKDLAVLTSLRRDIANKDAAAQYARMYYFPVDMSPEMLRIGSKEVIQFGVIKPSRILPVQIDFSKKQSVVALRALLDQCIGEERVLFSLLGNTLANFEDDVRLLKTVGGLMRKSDKLFVEVASVERATEQSAMLAAAEYRNSEAFIVFAMSALAEYTDVFVSRDEVEVTGSVEQDKGVRIDVDYVNASKSRTSIRLPNNRKEPFLENDRIRLILSRKYTPSGIEALVADAGLDIQHREHVSYDGEEGDKGFGLEFLVLRPK